MQKISVITVCYNSEKTIEDTIRSVLAQAGAGTDYELEYILIDGASTDNTLKIIQKHISKIAALISEPDHGIYDAMNKGIRAATGDYIGILNSDDFYASDTVLLSVLQAFGENSTQKTAQEKTKPCKQADKENKENPPEPKKQTRITKSTAELRHKSPIDAVYGDLYYVSAANPKKIVRTWKPGPYRNGLFQKGWHPPHPTVFLKKIIYDNYGLFDTAFSIAADYELLLRFFEKHKIASAYVPKTLVHMRTGGTSNQSLKNIFLGNLECLTAWKKNGLKASPLFVARKILGKTGQLRLQQAK